MAVYYNKYTKCQQDKRNSQYCRIQYIKLQATLAVFHPVAYDAREDVVTQSCELKSEKPGGGDI